MKYIEFSYRYTCALLVYVNCCMTRLVSNIICQSLSDTATVGMWHKILNATFGVGYIFIK